jgi:hypothetical protein
VDGGHGSDRNGAAQPNRGHGEEGGGQQPLRDCYYGATCLRLFAGHIALTDLRSGVTIVILTNLLHTPALALFGMGEEDGGGGADGDGDGPPVPPAEQLLRAVCDELGIGRPVLA